MSDSTMEVTAENFATMVPGLELLDISAEEVEGQIERFTDVVKAELQEDIEVQGYASMVVPLNGGLQLAEIIAEKLKAEGATRKELNVIIASKDPMVESIKGLIPKREDGSYITDRWQWSGEVIHNIIESMKAQGHGLPVITDFLNQDEIVPGKYYLDGEVKGGNIRIVDDISDTKAAEIAIRKAIVQKNSDTTVFMRPCSRKEGTKPIEGFDHNVKIVPNKWITSGFLMNGGVVTDRRREVYINTLERYCGRVIVTSDDFEDRRDEFNSPGSLDNYIDFLENNALRRFTPNGTKRVQDTMQFIIHLGIENVPSIKQKFSIARTRVNSYWFGDYES